MLSLNRTPELEGREASAGVDAQSPCDPGSKQANRTGSFWSTCPLGMYRLAGGSEQVDDGRRQAMAEGGKAGGGKAHAHNRPMRTTHRLPSLELDSRINGCLAPIAKYPFSASYLSKSQTACTERCHLIAVRATWRKKHWAHRFKGPIHSLGRAFRGSESWRKLHVGRTRCYVEDMSKYISHPQRCNLLHLPIPMMMMLQATAMTSRALYCGISSLPRLVGAPMNG